MTSDLAAAAPESEVVGRARQARAALRGSRSGRWRLLVTLGALSTFGPLSLDLYLPALPQLTGQLHASQLSGQLTLSASMLGLAVGQVLAGPVSDAVGRRRPMIVGVLAFALLSVACAVAPSMPVLVAARFLQGLGGAAGLVTARAVVRDVFDGAEAARVFASLMLVSGLAPILAPVAGSQLMRWTDWRGIFLVLAGLGLLLAVAAATVPETLPAPLRRVGGLRDTGRVFAELLTDRVFMGYALATGLGGAAMFTYISASSFVLQSGYQISAQTFSMIFAANAAGIMLVSQVSARLVSRFGPRRLFTVGLVSTLVGALLLTGAVLGHLGLAAVTPALFVVVASQGLVMPNGVALALAGYGSAAGSASAQFGVQQFLIGAAVGPVAGLAGASALAMAAIMVVVAGLGLLVFAVMTRPRAARHDQDHQPGGSAAWVS